MRVEKSSDLTAERSKLAIASFVGDVATRFECYNYCYPSFNIDNHILDTLALDGNEKVVDVGSDNGGFLYNLFSSREHRGQLVGVEPFTGLQIVPISPHAVMASSVENVSNEFITYSQSVAQHLPASAKNADVILGRFMMYCIPEDQHIETLKGFKDSLSEAGRVVISTSGDFNKPRHRNFEDIIGTETASRPPGRMNSSFTSEKAQGLLPELFNNVYHVSYKGHMVFRNVSEATAYFRSLLTMHGFYNPPLDEQTMHKAIRQKVTPVVRREIGRTGRFVDYVERDYFICNDSPEGFVVNDDGETKTIKGYEQKVISEA